jgi:hypothetical protein
MFLAASLDTPRMGRRWGAAARFALLREYLRHPGQDLVEVG